MSIVMGAQSPATRGAASLHRALNKQLICRHRAFAGSGPSVGWRQSAMWGFASPQPRDTWTNGGGQSPSTVVPGWGQSGVRAPIAVAMARKKAGFAELLTKGGFGAPREARPREPLRRGQVSPPRPVPAGIQRPPYADSGEAPPFSSDLQVHDARGIECMRAAGQLAARVRDYAGKLVKPGVTTDEIDAAVHESIVTAGAYPSPLNYAGFPKSVCTSVNECICHGIPDSRPLQDGDIVNIDVTVYLNGYHGDTSKTFLCGNVSKPAQRLVQVTEECLQAAIAICGPAVEYKRIGHAIHALADKYGYGVVRKFIGHGVGRVFHAGPAILHYRNNEPGRMVVGQTFTIEPMLTMGGTRDVMWDDGWTAVTADGSLSAQFEHTLLITEAGVEVLTA